VALNPWPGAHPALHLDMPSQDIPNPHQDLRKSEPLPAITGLSASGDSRNRRPQQSSLIGDLAAAEVDRPLVGCLGPTYL
jgi:hypothetical protein